MARGKAGLARITSSGLNPVMLTNTICVFDSPEVVISKITAYYCLVGFLERYVQQDCLVGLGMRRFARQGSLYGF